MARVTFLPDGRVVEVADGTTLFDAGAKAGVAIDTACVGKGTCGLCRVRIVGSAEGLSPYGDEEERHLGNLYHLTRVRLACRTRVSGEVTVEPVAKKVRPPPVASIGRGPGRR